MTARTRDVHAHPDLYGVMGEFADAEPLLAAARAAHADGFRKLDAYAPFHVEGLADAIGTPPDRVPLITSIGGLVGGAGTYALQYYSAVIDYPFNSGGRPLDSWPVFIVPTFEMTVLFAALSAFVGMLVLNGLPKLIHPVFDAREFDLASRNRFFLLVRAADPRFDAHAVRRFLDAQAAKRVFDVPRDRRRADVHSRP